MDFRVASLDNGRYVVVVSTDREEDDVLEYDNEKRLIAGIRNLLGMKKLGRSFTRRNNEDF